MIIVLRSFTSLDGLANEANVQLASDRYVFHTMLIRTTLISEFDC